MCTPPLERLKKNIGEHLMTLIQPDNVASFSSKTLRIPKLYIRTKYTQSGVPHDYYMATFRNKGKTVNVHIGSTSMDKSEAIELATTKKIMNLTNGNLSTSDFTFQNEKKDSVNFQEIREFVEKHEWLGRMSLYPSHIFTARYKGVLAGVLIMDMPPTFSNTLGDHLDEVVTIKKENGELCKHTSDVERLISRGASISWAPHNLASWLIAKSIKWMVKNTQYRLFFGYSDPTFNEVGTIYQASNFFCLGQSFGTGYQYCIYGNRWVSDRYFRSRSVYKRLAKEDGIEWLDEWQNGDIVFFNKMPIEIAQRIKQLSKDYQLSCDRRPSPPKRKYCYVAGIDNRERKKLLALFNQLNQTYPYIHREMSNAITNGCVA